MSECSVTDCNERTVARGLCNRHYARDWRARHRQPARPRPTVEERFWAKVQKLPGPDACWIWTAALNGCGYGAFTLPTGRKKGRQVRAHRFAYELLHGPIPGGLPLDHTCGRPLCVNPAHLEPVSLAENIRRAAREITHCRRAGHPLSGDNLRINTRGARVCVACARESRERSRARAAA